MGNQEIAAEIKTKIDTCKEKNRRTGSIEETEILILRHRKVDRTI